MTNCLSNSVCVCVYLLHNLLHYIFLLYIYYTDTEWYVCESWRFDIKFNNLW